MSGRVRYVSLFSGIEAATVAFHQIGWEPVAFSEVEDELVGLLQSEEDPTFSIFSDQSVPVGEIVGIMNIAKRNHYKVILATQPE